jgi:hypothetical protein
LARRFASASYIFAARLSASSRNPPISPALIMLIISNGKWSGWRLIAADSGVPPCTSARICASAAFIFGLVAWSSRIDSDRSIVRPEEVIEANWRESTARSFRVVRLLKPGSLISFCKPSPAPDTASGTSRWSASALAAAAADSESILPLSSAPVASIAS